MRHWTLGIFAAVSLVLGLGVCAKTIAIRAPNGSLVLQVALWIQSQVRYSSLVVWDLFYDIYHIIK